jgi:hypothetical protein
MSWPMSDRKLAGWKMERSGRTCDSVCTGVAYEKASDAAVSAEPEARVLPSSTFQLNLSQF